MSQVTNRERQPSKNDIESVRRQRTFRLVKRWLIAIVIIAIYAWSFWYLKGIHLNASAGRAMKAIGYGFIHPDTSYILQPGGEDLTHSLIETLGIAVLGTFISAIICTPFAFWAARNMNKFRWLSSTGKFVLAAIRVFPELIMAILFITAVGLGPFAGVLALGFHSVGMLGKLFGEAIENSDLSPREALQASGANRIQTLWFAVIPTVLPAFLSYTLYRFEISVRSATILGMVGAGGIGLIMNNMLASLQYNRVMSIIVYTLVVVVIIDTLSNRIREKLL
jgi:phosphonate transport system permease protein